MADYIILLVGIVTTLLLLLIGGCAGYAIGAKEEKLERHLWKIKQRAHKLRHRAPSGSIKAKTLEDAEREDRKPLMAAIAPHVPADYQRPPTLEEQNQPGIYEP